MNITLTKKITAESIGKFSDAKIIRIYSRLRKEGKIQEVRWSGYSKMLGAPWADDVREALDIYYSNRESAAKEAVI